MLFLFHPPLSVDIKTGTKVRRPATALKTSNDDSTNRNKKTAREVCWIQSIFKIETLQLFEEPVNILGARAPFASSSGALHWTNLCPKLSFQRIRMPLPRPRNKHNFNYNIYINVGGQLPPRPYVPPSASLPAPPSAELSFDGVLEF